MATPAPAATPVGPDTLITVKVLYNDNTRRFKIPLRDLGARVFPQKVCPHSSSDRSSSSVPPLKMHICRPQKSWDAFPDLTSSLIM
jgi:hypothetical protein